MDQYMLCLINKSLMMIRRVRVNGKINIDYILYRGIFMFLFLITTSYKNVIFNRYVQLESAKKYSVLNRKIYSIIFSQYKQFTMYVFQFKT